MIFTFILVSTVYAVAIGKPNFGNVGPLIIGLSLYACASVGALALLTIAYATALAESLVQRHASGSFRPSENDVDP